MGTRTGTSHTSAKRPANFESDRLSFRSLKPSDAGPSWTDWLNNPAIADGLGVAMRQLNVSELSGYIASFDQDRRNLIGIFEKPNGKLIGLFMVEIDRRHGNANCHILIGEKRFWGRRVAYEAGEALVHHCFRQWKLEKVMFCPLADNAPAIAVCLAHNLHLEGILSEHRSAASGKRVDQLLFAILRSDYEQRLAARNKESAPTS
ncbi:MAG: GNAT family N-acetyltransferase [Gammaproteobacteria bacterium]|nr:GNAT family N-acetyltransferase [Gammaproteobacteria bacterium]